MAKTTGYTSIANQSHTRVAQCIGESQEACRFTSGIGELVTPNGEKQETTQAEVLAEWSSNFWKMLTGGAEDYYKQTLQAAGQKVPFVSNLPVLDFQESTFADVTRPNIGDARAPNLGKA